MGVRPRFLIGVGLITAAIAYLIVTAIRNTSEYYLTVEEIGARQAEYQGQPLRIAGRVKPGSISWDPATLRLEFSITAIPNPDASGVQPAAAITAPSFHVVCLGQPKPDMFAEGRDVIVEGRLVSANEVSATQVLTSCPSKYVPKKPGAPAG
jgi:cytochrome c-type biogenesis protein CcmE